MAIIRFTKDSTDKYAYLNIFPDQFLSAKEKQQDSYVKNVMDYFSNQAHAQYIDHRNTFVKNYRFIKGIMTREDFYEEEDVKSFTEVLTRDTELPKNVVMYSIMATPINELVGEVSKRPDKYKAKAFDDESRSEELQYKTEILQKYILGQARADILEKAAMEGVEIPDEEIEGLTLDKVKDELDGYTSVAEKWCNHILNCLKAEFNIKEKSEDTFRDLLVCAREWFHIYEDNSKLGFNVEVVNPKNEWHLMGSDKKYTSDPSGRMNGAYAGGKIEVMELSEIIESSPDLTKEEIDHLRSGMNNFGLINARESNLSNGVNPGTDSITYDTYDPLVQQSQMILEAEVSGYVDDMRDFLGQTNNGLSFGHKFVVITSYWVSKKKIGRVQYLDEMQTIQSSLVDENYKNGDIPTQVGKIQWGWINEWYQGKKWGDDVYSIKPLKILNYYPIIGTIYENKNAEPKSVTDMMKPFQVTYNVCMNQMFELLKKEIGNVGVVNIRRIPRVKDGDGQDDIDVWEMEAKDRGIIFDDDSPENTKAPVSNQSVARNIDLTRSSEIQTRYNLAIQLKNECWELIGMSKQRLGSVSASESATGTNAAIAQSYTQTEPLYVAHEYVLGQLYQACIDASLYIASSKPETTLSYITSTGQSAFIQVNGNDLKFRDIKLFMTNRPEDTKMFNELKSLSQAVIQNGGSLYDVIELYTTDSVREMKKVFRDLRDKTDSLQQQASQQKQAEMEQNKAIADAQIQQAYQEQQEIMQNTNYQNELDRLAEKEIAIIKATGFGEVTSEDNNNNGIPDILELSNIALARDKANNDFTGKLTDIQSKNKQFDSKMSIEKDKIKVARENMVNDLAVARENAKNRNNKKS
jgi:hypothetical protein